ncbi:hypothetical protein HIM_03962 [Hirsutella minnesotensis 3608]|uniref:HMG box domain-containing protein n=1 Tax=Hirsutella minnesotensis 3608 TaxID=1043627 RepID=A0A0F7ZLR0_9HYPO|nr:hypothetical protein HIM_03962 [Hirsutella minnesotensis 3608]
MLTSIGRAAARRSLTTASSRHVASVRSAAALTRVAGSPRFISASIRSHAAVAAASKKASTTRKAAVSKQTKAAKPKAKTTAKKPAKKTKAPAKRKVKAKAKKPKPKKPKKPKTLTPEEKEKVLVRELKKLALLKGPTRGSPNVWSLFLKENFPKGGGSLAEKIAPLKQQFANLSQLELKKQRDSVTKKREQGEWVAAHPPEVIYLANRARRHLARRSQNADDKKPRLLLIRDERLPKRPNGPFVTFLTSRIPDLDMSNNTSVFRDLAAEWRSMSDASKKPFIDAAAEETRKTAAQRDAIRQKAKEYMKQQHPAVKAIF